MSGFRMIQDDQVRAALMTTSRQYLAGELARPQQLEHVPDARIEIGITAYHRGASERPHRHALATEYQYVLRGWTQYWEIGSDQVHDFRAGDFYAIAPGTSYAQRSKAGTEILFVKVPAGNDKEQLDTDEALASWLSKSPRTLRVDYHHDPAAPAANSIRPAAAVAVRDERARFLLLRRRDSGKWTLPGGTLELDESLEQCALREVAEESGLEVEITQLIGAYSDPDIRIAYSDGEVRREFTVVYAGR